MIFEKYHYVCHDCSFEGVTPERSEAEDCVEEHREIGHEAEFDKVFSK
ncbi:MAG: hypothetical protein SV253_02790 [Halobacteria archaeon]|nr:hypothetical protein [Halobacteria archaeon]